MDEKMSVIKADGLLMMQEQSRKVVPGEKTNVYFANSRK